MSALSYCSNWKQLEEQVDSRIKEATATGLSLERLSRKVRLSGWFGNLSLGGTDVTTLLSGRSGIVIVLIVLFFLVYPVFVAVIVVLVLKYFLISLTKHVILLTLQCHHYISSIVIDHRSLQLPHFGPIVWF